MTNSAPVVTAVQAIVDEADRMRGSYFFNPPTAAGMRRSYERQHSHKEVSWEENGHSYTAAFEVSCSCRNVYARGIYTRDGKPTTLTAIRNSLKRMQAA